jgi:hypothetical protein
MTTQHKIAAFLICGFTEQDALVAARVPQHQQQLHAHNMGAPTNLLARRHGPPFASERGHFVLVRAKWWWGRDETAHATAGFGLDGRDGEYES